MSEHWWVEGGGKYYTYDSCFLSRLRKRGNEKRGRGREGEREQKRLLNCNEFCSFVSFFVK